MSIVDTFTPPYHEIVDLEYYKAHYSLPLTKDVNTQEAQVDKLIIQCIDQVNVLCAGRPFKEWDKANGERKFWLRKAICAYVEYCIDTAKVFVNKQFQASGVLPFSLNASANDANFERFRYDIIKLLKNGDWYQTIGGFDLRTYNGTIKNERATKELAEFITYLKTIFKTIDNENQLSNGLILSGQEIASCGNILAASGKQIQGFKLVDCDIKDLVEQILREHRLIRS